MALLEASDAVDEATDGPRVETEAGFRRLVLLAKGGLLPIGQRP